MKAIHELELDQVMEIGKVGKDGRVGGRLERELEVFESVVRGKRKGYRDKVKARESAGGTSNVEGPAGEDDEDRGEPEKKRIRRTSDEDPEQDEELLDAQLNGPATPPPPATGGSAPNYGTVGGRWGAAEVAEAADNDETEDDPEIEDEEPEDEDVVDDEEEDEQGQEGNEEDEDRIDVDEGGGSSRARTMLAPNGRAEVGSDDESD